MEQKIFSVEEAVSFIPWLREQLGIILECFNAIQNQQVDPEAMPVSYTHLRAHETLR